MRTRPFRRFAIVVGCACALLTITALRQPAEASSAGQRQGESPSADFLNALQTANAFLGAWVSRDVERGIQLISERLRAEVADESWLRQFLAGLSNPHHQAFEIGRGRRKGLGRYSFPVILYELYTGEQKGTAYPGTLEIAREGHVWRVDRLPRTSDNP